MRSRSLAALTSLVLLAVLVLTGCGGGSGGTNGDGAAAAPAATFDTAACPTENTRSFAKTRFAADVGGSIFLVNRYLVQPYRAGQFQSGADGRTGALIKAGLAAAATVKLLDNATENAKANPTLCKTVAQPLSQLRQQISGLVDRAKSGNLDPAAIAGVGGLLGSIQQGASSAGVPVQERQVGLGG